MADTNLKATVNATFVKRVSVDLASATANTTTTTTATVQGVKAKNMYLVAFADADLDAGLVLQSVVYCEVDDQLILRVTNPTAGAIDAAAATLNVIGL